MPTSVTLVSSRLEKDDTIDVQNNMIYKFYAERTASLEWQSRQQLVEQARVNVDRIVAQFNAVKVLHGSKVLYDMQVPLLCIAQKTEHQLVQHAQLVQQYFCKMSASLSRAIVSVQDAISALNCNPAFVRTFFAQSSENANTAKHAIFWLHGPCGVGKLSWIKSFWHGWLGVVPKIWNHHLCASYSIVDICDSLVQLFDNCMSDSNQYFATCLVPVVLQNLDTTFEMLSDKHASQLYAHLIELLLRYASSNTSDTTYRKRFVIVYITTSSKSKFLLRELQKRLEITKSGASRLVKFCTPSDAYRQAFLYRLAVDGYARPSVIQVQCKQLNAYLSKEFHRIDVLDDPDSKRSTSKWPTIPQLVKHYSPLLTQTSIAAWLKSCDAQLLVRKHGSKNLLANQQSATAVELGHSQISTMDANVILSLLLWPSYFSIQLGDAINIYKVARLNYGFLRLLKQLIMNAHHKPCHASFVDLPKGSKPTSWIDNYALKEKSVLADSRRLAIDLLIKASKMTIGLPSQDSKFVYANTILRAMLETQESMVLTPAKRALQLMMLAIVKVLFFASATTTPSTKDLVGWK